MCKMFTINMHIFLFPERLLVRFNVVFNSSAGGDACVPQTGRLLQGQRLQVIWVSSEMKLRDK